MKKLIIAMSIVGMMALASLAPVFVAHGEPIPGCPQGFFQTKADSDTKHIDRNNDVQLCLKTTPQGRQIIIDNHVLGKGY